MAGMGAGYALYLLVALTFASLVVSIALIAVVLVVTIGITRPHRIVGALIGAFVLAYCVFAAIFVLRPSPAGRVGSPLQELAVFAGFLVVPLMFAGAAFGIGLLFQRRRPKDASVSTG
jgi:hypothetical protein